jgi:transposase
MSKKEIDRIGVLETILNKKMSQVDGAKILRVSDRQMRRMIKRVREKGIQSIVHQNRGKPSPKKIRSKISTKICDLYKKKYHDFGPTFALEKLQEHHGISISRESLRQILIKDGLWRIRQGRKGTVHTWRERKHYEGEMVQIDGSHHRWLEDRLDQEFCLMAYIDDATGKVYARFYEYEGVFPALDSFQRFVSKNGCPKTIYIDRHSTYKTTRKATLDEDLEGCGSNTQFQQVMKNIDVRVIHARSPQAKV